VKTWHRASALFFLVVSAVVIQQSVFVLRVNDHGQPGSGLMPLGLGVALALLSLGLLFAKLPPDAQRQRFWEAGAWVYPLVAVLITAVFIVVFDDVGVGASVTVLVAGWLWVVGRKPILVAVLAGVVTAACVHLVFDRLLRTPFPRGLLF
jgi:hypothetical protein